MGKKGSVDIQFNWIYVVVVGTIIILAGTSIIMNIKKNSQLSLITDVKVYLDNILKNVQLNNMAESEIELPDIDIQFACDSFSIKDADLSNIPLPDNIIFAPGSIQEKMLGYSMRWYMPYETEFFSYVTSQNIKYVFLESEDSEKLFNLSPGNLNKELTVEYSDYSEERNYKIRYITLDNIPSPSSLGEFRHIKDKDVTLIKVKVLEDPLNFPDSFGEITFYVKEEEEFAEQGSAFFMDRATLLAALYAEDAEVYGCNLVKSLKKLSLISDMKKDKVAIFSADALYTYCPYEESIALLTGLAEKLKEPGLDEGSLAEIYRLAREIEKENLLLNRLSCPLVY